MGKTEQGITSLRHKDTADVKGRNFFAHPGEVAQRRPKPDSIFEQAQRSNSPKFTLAESENGPAEPFPKRHVAK
jgi:hypothetical protein